MMLPEAEAIRQQAYGLHAHRRLTRLIWTGGTIVLVLIAFAALLRLGGDIDQRWRTFPAPLGLAWSGALLVACGCAAIGLVGVVIWAGRPGTAARAVLAGGVSLTLIVRLFVLATIHPALVSDWLNYHETAVAIASGGPWFGAVPTGYPIMLAALYRLLGPNPFLGEILNLVLALWTAAMIFVITRSRFGLPASAAALLLYAIFPSQVLMTTILGTEVAYGAFIVTAVVAAILGDGPHWVRWTVLLGLVLGLSQYVRTTSIFLVPAFLVLIWLQDESRRRAIVRSVLLVVVVLVLLLPAVGANLTAGEGLSLTTSRYGGWSLLIGLNTATNGHYNLEDQRLIGLPTKSIAWERRATELAIQRLTADPIATAKLFVRKFPQFWGADDYGGFWTAVPPGFPDTPVSIVELLASQVVYATSLVFAAIGIIFWRRRPQALQIIILMLIGSVALLHTFVEIQTRYHSYVVPLLCVLAGGGLVAFYRGRPVRTWGEDEPESKAL